MNTTSDETRTIETEGGAMPLQTGEREYGPGTATTKLPMALESLERSMSGYPEETRRATLRLFRLGRERGFSMVQVAALIGKTTSTVSKLFSGKYSVADFRPLTEAIETALERDAAARDAQSGDRFAMTSTTEKLWTLFEVARMDRSIAMVFANSQIGKTYNSQMYLRKHPEVNAIYVKLPSGGGKRGTIERIATALGYSPRGGMNILIDRILRGIKTSGIELMIFDEYSQIFDPHKRRINFQTAQFLREVWDETQTGMVLMTTDIDLEFRGVLKETLRRATAELALPDVPPARDLVSIAKAHGYPAPDKAIQKLIAQIIGESGMLKFCRTLRRGVNLSGDRKPSWAKFTEAHQATAELMRRIQG